MSVWAGWFLLASLATSHAQGTASSPVTFSRDIQPLLAKHCVVCHGPDVDEAGLRLDRAGEGSESDAIAAVIEPGDAEASELLRRVTTEDAAARMPPDGDPLEPSEVAKLRQWIDQGAQWETHWAFQPVSRPAVPQSAGRADNPRAANPIDAFVQRRLEAADLSLSEPADRATLIKRLSYDLTGLPNPACSAWRSRGGVLVTWTVTDEAGLTTAREMADNIIFEHVRP